jgi:hypothetical protein
MSRGEGDDKSHRRIQGEEGYGDKAPVAEAQDGCDAVSRLCGGLRI